MIIVNAKFYIKEDKKSQFLKEIEGLISASKRMKDVWNTLFMNLRIIS